MSQDILDGFHNIVHQAAKLFPEYLTHVTSAVKNHIPSGPTTDILIKLLTWEGLSTFNPNVITPVRNKDIHMWVLAFHDIDIQNGPIFALIVSINALVNAKLDKDGN